MFKTYFKNINKKSGFTLIETLVAVGIFSVIMMVAVSSLMTIISVNNRTQAIKTTINNLNYSINIITDALYNIETDADRKPMIKCLNTLGQETICSGLNAGFGFYFFEGTNPTPSYYRIYGSGSSTLMLGTNPNPSSIGDDINILPTDLQILNYEKIFKLGGNGGNAVGNIGNGDVPLYTLMISGMYNGKREVEKVKFNLETSFSRLGI